MHRLVQIITTAVATFPVLNAQGDTRRAKRAFPIALAIGTNMGLACKMTIGKYANVLRSQAHYRKN